MRFLADESVHPVVVGRLRAAGLDVEWIKETASGSTDDEILARPDISETVLITYDSDFGELVFNRSYAAPYAIIYSRLGRAEPRFVADKLQTLVERGLAEGHMIVITTGEDRIKPFLPGV